MTLTPEQVAAMVTAVKALDDAMKPLTSTDSREAIRVMEAQSVLYDVVTVMALGHKAYTAGST